MKSKTIAALAATILSIMTISSGVLAQNAPAANTNGAYKESSINLATEAIYKDVPPVRICPRPGGVIDYFVARDNIIDPGKEPPPSWFHSENGGATWEKIDISWCVPPEKKYFELGEFMDFYVTENGEAYCIKESGTKIVKDGSAILSFPKFKIVKRVNNKGQDIPNVELAAKDNWGYEIAGIEKNGDITVMEKTSAGSVGMITTLYTYDGQTGALKKKTKCPNDKFMYRCYANGIMYGIDYLTNAPQWKLQAYRMEDGAQVFSIPFPGPGGENLYVDTLCAKQDGTLYITSSDGLFRLDPGSQTPVKLLAGTDCLLGRNDVSYGASSVSSDGSVYMLVSRLVTIDEERTRSEDSKIYCYSPK